MNTPARLRSSRPVLCPICRKTPDTVKARAHAWGIDCSQACPMELCTDWYPSRWEAVQAWNHAKYHDWSK